MLSMKALLARADDYAPHLLALLRNTRAWISRRVVNIQFLDAETLLIDVSIDVDLSQDDACSAYLDLLETKKLPDVLIPIRLHQPRLASFHTADFEGNRLSLLTTEESEVFKEAVLREIGKQKFTEPEWSIRKANQSVAAELQERRLALIAAPLAYFLRHDIRYSYLSPLTTQQERRYQLLGQKLLGHPQLIRLKLLHAEGAASYHFEVQGPPSCVIVDRRLDAQPTRSLDMELRGGYRDPEVSSGVDTSSNLWHTGEHAVLYLRNTRSLDVPSLQQGVWLNLWIMIERSTVWRPLVTAFGVLAVLIVVAILPLELDKSLQSPATAAAFYLGAAGVFLGYLSPPRPHPLSELLYQGARYAVILAASSAFAGFLIMLGVLTKRDDNPLLDAGTRQLLLTPVIAASGIALIWLFLIYFVGCKESSAKNYVCQLWEKGRKLDELSIVSREVG